MQNMPKPGPRPGSDDFWPANTHYRVSEEVITMADGVKYQRRDAGAREMNRAVPVNNRLSVQERRFIGKLLDPDRSRAAELHELDLAQQAARQGDLAGAKQHLLEFLRIRLAPLQL